MSNRNDQLDLFAEEVTNEVAELSVEVMPAKAVLGSASCLACLSSFATGGSSAGTFSCLTSASSV